MCNYFQIRMNKYKFITAVVFEIAYRRLGVCGCEVCGFPSK